MHSYPPRLACKQGAKLQLTAHSVLSSNTNASAISMSNKPLSNSHPLESSSRWIMFLYLGFAFCAHGSIHLGLQLSHRRSALRQRRLHSGRHRQLLLRPAW